MKDEVNFIAAKLTMRTDSKGRISGMGVILPQEQILPVQSRAAFLQSLLQKLAKQLSQLRSWVKQFLLHSDSE